MIRVMRWILRLAVLGILVVVWQLLPYLMTGPSRLLALLHLACMVVVVDCAFLILLVSLIPYRTQAQSAAEMRRHIQRQEHPQP